jgi:alkylation response protein AidB-like acyl-CoA dehydrogenase
LADYFTPGMRLYLDRLLDWPTLLRLRGREADDLESELGAYRTVLETVASLAESLERPAREAWSAEAELTPDGGANPPRHIREAYARLRENGLVSLPVGEQYGGYHLPLVLNGMVLEMISRADTSLMTIIGLQTGVAGDIERYGSEAVKQAFLPRFTAGEVQGCMDLTEPHAGSDLGAITTRATDTADGGVLLDGQKIYITNGGAEVHLVLARDGDHFEESKGTTRGLSLVLVPRHLPDGARNGVRVTRLEKKLGIHGSPTCEVVFEKARGTRLGEKGQGFRAMLDLMNNARLGVAAQALGLCEAALHDALVYARERQQFGHPILEQPLVRSMLSKMYVQTEAVRAFIYRSFELADLVAAREAVLRRGDLPDAERTRIASELERDTARLRLLTPLTKYFATEVCDDLTRDAMQVMGGIGYTMDADAAKLHADSLILTVYEGTSEIQASFALKEMGKGALSLVFEETREELSRLARDAKFEPLATLLLGDIDQTERAVQTLFGDIGYALLRAKLLAWMVIDIIAGTELLRQASVDASRFDLAETFVRRRTLELDTKARRIEENHEGRLERDQRLLEHASAAL